MPCAAPIRASAQPASRHLRRRRARGSRTTARRPAGRSPAGRRADRHGRAPAAPRARRPSSRRTQSGTRAAGRRTPRQERAPEHSRERQPGPDAAAQIDEKEHHACEKDGDRRKLERCWRLHSERMLNQLEDSHRRDHRMLVVRLKKNFRRGSRSVKEHVPVIERKADLRPQDDQDDARRCRPAGEQQGRQVDATSDARFGDMSCAHSGHRGQTVTGPAAVSSSSHGSDERSVGISSNDSPSGSAPISTGNDSDA